MAHYYLSKSRSLIIYLCEAFLLTQNIFASPMNIASRTECASLTLDGPLYITADCVDSSYSSIVIDIERDETSPVPHRSVSAHFNGSDQSINLYLPPADQWEGRFFHFVYPFQTSNATDEDIGFAADSGAYWVQIADTVGYRAEAAAAKWSRQIASAYYNTSDHIFGYLFGGSGGSFQTIGAVENSDGVWDGAIAYVQGVPVSDPTDFTTRALAGFVLGGKTAEVVGGKSQLIEDAVSPGGTGDPFAGLTKFERSILKEATLMGVPIRSWEDFAYVGSTTSLRLLNASFLGLDPTYTNDFWTVAGYEGTEQSELGNFFRAALVNTTTTIASVTVNSTGVATAIVLEDLPEISNIDGLDFSIYNDAGTLQGVIWGALDVDTKTLNLYDASNTTARASLRAGQTVTVDNKHFLAMHTYHRHQVPPTTAGFPSFNQFLGTDGQPIYPQRDILIAETLAKGASGGGTQTGNYSGKLIVMDSLMDSDAFPWHADWYRTQVAAALGASYNSHYRLYYNDNANHNPFLTEGLAGQLVPYKGMLEFALRDLAAWAEGRGLPADSTSYKVTAQQVSVAATAAERHGIQPVVTLSANGKTACDAVVGSTVTLHARAEVPAGGGKIVSVEWDFLGTGEFTVNSLKKPVTAIDVTATTVYKSIGTVLPNVRIKAQREGNSSSPYAISVNLGRARVIVH